MWCAGIFDRPRQRKKSADKDMLSVVAGETIAPIVVTEAVPTHHFNYQVVLANPSGGGATAPDWLLTSQSGQVFGEVPENEEKATYDLELVGTTTYSHPLGTFLFVPEEDMHQVTSIEEIWLYDVLKMNLDGVNRPTLLFDLSVRRSYSNDMAQYVNIVLGGAEGYVLTVQGSNYLGTFISAGVGEDTSGEVETDPSESKESDEFGIAMIPRANGNYDVLFYGNGQLLHSIDDLEPSDALPAEDQYMQFARDVEFDLQVHVCENQQQLQQALLRWGTESEPWVVEEHRGDFVLQVDRDLGGRDKSNDKGQSKSGAGASDSPSTAEVITASVLAGAGVVAASVLALLG